MKLKLLLFFILSQIELFASEQDKNAWLKMINENSLLRHQYTENDVTKEKNKFYIDLTDESEEKTYSFIHNYEQQRDHSEATQINSGNGALRSVGTQTNNPYDAQNINPLVIQALFGFVQQRNRPIVRLYQNSSDTTVQALVNMYSKQDYTLEGDDFEKSNKESLKYFEENNGPSKVEEYLKGQMPFSRQTKKTFVDPHNLIID